MDLIIESVVRKLIKIARLKLPLLIYILMNTIKNFTITHLQLN